VAEFLQINTVRIPHLLQQSSVIQLATRQSLPDEISGTWCHGWFCSIGAIMCRDVASSFFV